MAVRVDVDSSVRAETARMSDGTTFVRRPRPEILDGTWQAPVSAPVS